jgi:transposase, IS5 family
MRIRHHSQLRFDCIPIPEIELNTECRHRIIPVLRGLQQVYSQPQLLQNILSLIEGDVLGDAQPNRGREGMTYWQILVLGAAKAGCSYTYDDLQELAENHRNLRAMMQVGEWGTESFQWQRIQANLCRLTPETVEEITHLIVGEGHRLEPEAATFVRGDSFVCETNVHYPTESSLILDGLKKILGVAPKLAELIGFSGWRQSASLYRKAKTAARQLSHLKKGGKNYQAKLQAGYEELFRMTDLVLPRVQEMLDVALDELPLGADGLPVGEAVSLCHQLTYWHAVTEHVVSTAWRRVMEGETVPNCDKLFSLFEPDTELIKRGKAGKPNEFGHQVLVIEDAAGYICHFQVMGREEDDRDVLISAMQILQKRLNYRIRRASFDRGFHSDENQRQLSELLEHPCLPKPGKIQGAKQAEQATVEFRQARRWHPGIESAIGALQSGNGLDRCRDHTSLGFRRYVALGVLGRNLSTLGKRLLQKEAPKSEAASSKREAA